MSIERREGMIRLTNKAHPRYGPSIDDGSCFLPPEQKCCVTPPIERDLAAVASPAIGVEAFQEIEGPMPWKLRVASIRIIRMKVRRMEGKFQWCRYIYSIGANPGSDFRAIFDLLPNCAKRTPKLTVDDPSVPPNIPGPTSLPA